MTISCPRCGLAFETRATTNTRCHRCKTVVRIGSGPSTASRPSVEVATDEIEGGSGLVVLAFVALAGAIVVPIVQALGRRRLNIAPVVGAVGSNGPAQVPPSVTGEQGTGRAHTGPNSTETDSVP